MFEKEHLLVEITLDVHIQSYEQKSSHRKMPSQSKPDYFYERHLSSGKASTLGSKHPRSLSMVLTGVILSEAFPTLQMTHSDGPI